MINSLELNSRGILRNSAGKLFLKFLAFLVPFFLLLRASGVQLESKTIPKSVDK
jgi:hypothetical protein